MDSNQVISPILLQRQCDGGKCDMTDEQWATKVALRLQGQPAGFFGCGRWFQWYWGMNCICPNCGSVWSYTLEDQKRFRVISTLDMIKEREIVDRITLEVLVRLGTR